MAAPFAAEPTWAKRDFNGWVQGVELVTFYESSSPGGFRGFCRDCGSSILNKFSAAHRLLSGIPTRRRAMGSRWLTFDDDPGVRPAAHSFVASKAPWYEITDDLPKFAGGIVWPRITEGNPD